MRDETKPVPVNLKDRGIEGLAQTGRTRQHDREHGLDVGRRARDHAEDFCGGGLLLQSLRFALQRLGQALLEVADPGAFVPLRFARLKARLRP